MAAAKRKLDEKLDSEAVDSSAASEDASAPPPAPAPHAPRKVRDGYVLCRVVGSNVEAEGRTHAQDSVAEFSRADVDSLPGILVPME